MFLGETGEGQKNYQQTPATIERGGVLCRSHLFALPLPVFDVGRASRIKDLVSPSRKSSTCPGIRALQCRVMHGSVKFREAGSSRSSAARSTCDRKPAHRAVYLRCPFCTWGLLNLMSSLPGFPSKALLQSAWAWRYKEASRGSSASGMPSARRSAGRAHHGGQSTGAETLSIATVRRIFDAVYRGTPGVRASWGLSQAPQGHAGIPPVYAGAIPLRSTPDGICHDIPGTTGPCS